MCLFLNPTCLNHLPLRLTTNLPPLQPQILAHWVYTGPEEKGLELMAPVFALNPVRSEKMAAFYESARDPGALGTTVELEIFNSDAMRAVPADATAYPWRDSIAYMMFELTWSSGVGEAAAISLAQDLSRDFVATSGYDDLAVYVNYASGNETLEQRYGATKLKRLAETKKKWDPEQVFGYSSPLPTKYP